MKKAIIGGIVAVLSFAIMLWSIRIIGFTEETTDFMLVFCTLCAIASLCGFIALAEATSLGDRIMRMFE